MTKEQQIEEMARDILNAGVALEGTDFVYGITGDDHFTRLATKLYAAGYRKADEVRKETARENIHDLRTRVGQYAMNIIVDEEHRSWIESRVIWDFADYLSRHYGVEVEE